MLSAASAPPAAVLDALSRHKAEIVALLRPGRDGWSAEDWQVFFDERAGIAEFDGGLPRAEAEAQRLRLLRRRMAEPQSGALAGRTLSRMRRPRTRPRSAAALRRRTHRPRLAAFALLARLVRGPESQGRVRADGNGDQCASRSPDEAGGAIQASAI